MTNYHSKTCRMIRWEQKKGMSVNIKKITQEHVEHEAAIRHNSDKESYSNFLNVVFRW